MDDYHYIYMILLYMLSSIYIYIIDLYVMIFLCYHIYIYISLFSSSSGVHPLWMTTSFSSSLHLDLTVAMVANVSYIVCHKVDTNERNLEMCGQCGMLVSAIASESCCMIVFSIKI